MQTRNGNTFMRLSDGNVFGDYQIINDLTSNIIFKVGFKEDSENEGQGLNSKFMGCERGVVEDLCDLYPKTAENLKMRSLEKRAIYLYYMGEPTSAIRQA